ncbi:MAG: hypothetical protein ACOYOO_09305 [Saprospiraceae bacterium]|jgi:hypothetical protein
MKFLFLFLILQFQLSPVPSGKWYSGEAALATFARTGLHTNHYWSGDHTALVEVVEAKEKDMDEGSQGFDCIPELPVFSAVLSLCLPSLNALNLQRVGRPLFILHSNYRL